MFVVYILKSEVDGSFYVGYASDLERRLTEHNEGRSLYTSKKKPWKIVYQENIDTKTDAIKREKFLKKQRNRDFYNRLIQEFQNNKPIGG